MDAPDVVSLARTCRTFKELALDVLWEELEDLSLSRGVFQKHLTNYLRARYAVPKHLLRCLMMILSHFPFVFYVVVFVLQTTYYADRVVYPSKLYTSHPNHTTLRGWSRRKIITILSNSPTTEPLFPNLRHLHSRYRTQAKHLLHLPFPSLISFNVRFENPDKFTDALRSFPQSSPNIQRLFLGTDRSDIAFSKLISDCTRRWRNLQIVSCPHITLDVATILHLSRMPALTQLNFLLDTTFPSFDSPFCFSDLHHLTLRSESLGPISQLLSQTRLPVVTKFRAEIGHCPCKQVLSTFWANFHVSITGHAIEGLILRQSTSGPVSLVRSQAPLLSSEDLQPCMEFRAPRCFVFDVAWSVDLKDNELVTLASAWPHLEVLLINSDLGWNTPRGVQDHTGRLVEASSKMPVAL